MTAILKVRDKQTGEFISIPAIKGDTGATPNIALSVTMLEENAEPTVDKSGTAENPTIVIGIPSGHIFTFEDFSPEQIELLQQPAIAAATTANTAASNADTEASTANEKAILADQKATAANNAAIAATTAANSANTAADAASEAVKNITTSLNGKLNISADNIKNGMAFGANLNAAGIRTIVSSISSGAYTYRKWSDGFVEYFGLHTLSGASGTLYLPITFSTDRYYVITHGITTIRHLKAYRSASSFKWYQNNVSSGTDVNETNDYFIYCAGFLK